MKPPVACCLLVAAGLLAASTARAQFVPLQRCRAAYPCSIPFGLQYRPDSLIVGQYGTPSNTAVVARLELRRPFIPRLETRTPPDIRAIDDAVRKFLATHPPPNVATAPPRRNRVTPGG